MRAVSIVAICVLAATAACDEPKKQPGTSPEPARPAEAGPIDARPSPAAKDASVPTAPAGTARLAAVPGHIAVHFLSSEQLIAQIDVQPVTFASSAKEPLNELLAKLGAATAKRGKIVLVGAGGNIKDAQKVRARPKGRKVDIDFHDAYGSDLSKLLAKVGGLELRGDMGGRFALRVREMPGNQLFAILATMCGGSLKLAKGVATIAESKCKTVAPPPFEDTEATYDELGGRVRWPKREVRKLRVAGLVTGKRKRALLAASDLDFIEVKVGDVIGREEDECDPRKVHPEAAALDAEITKTEREARALEAKIDPLIDNAAPAAIAELAELRSQAAKLTARIDELQKKIEALEKSGIDLPADCAARGGQRYRWRVDAIDAKGVRFKALLGPTGDDVTPMRLELREG